jgi:hypothetical protein
VIKFDGYSILIADLTSQRLLIISFLPLLLEYSIVIIGFLHFAADVAKAKRLVLKVPSLALISCFRIVASNKVLGCFVQYAQS